MNFISMLTFYTIIVMGSLCNGYPLPIIENALFTNADRVASKAKRK